MPSRRFFFCLTTVASMLVAVGVGVGRDVATAAVAPSGPGAQASDGQTAQAVRVGIKPLDPFVVRSGARYSGFSIELWDEIARRNGWSTTYVWYDTLPPLLDDASSSKIDVGIAGISITRERESRMDFSHPMFNAGL